jgi:hypothetical protein
LLLVHVPPPGLVVYVVVPPLHIDDAPDIVEGKDNTVIFFVEMQPEGAM